MNVEETRARINDMAERVAEYKSRKSSCMQDLEQLRKRHRDDLKNETKYGMSKFASATLTVIDNLERASGSAKPEDLEQDGNLAKMHKDIGRAQELMKQALDDFKVAKMDPMDQVFDPNMHEAMFAVPMPGKDPNIVFHVMEPGYTIHERTLRAAKVGVSR